MVIDKLSSNKILWQNFDLVFIEVKKRVCFD